MMLVYRQNFFRSFFAPFSEYFLSALRYLVKLFSILRFANSFNKRKQILMAEK